MHTCDKHGGDPTYCDACREEHERKQHEQEQQRNQEEMNRRLEALSFAVPGIRVQSPDDVAEFIRATKAYLASGKDTALLRLCELYDINKKVTLE